MDKCLGKCKHHFEIFICTSAVFKYVRSCDKKNKQQIHSKEERNFLSTLHRYSEQTKKVCPITEFVCAQPG